MLNRAADLFDELHCAGVRFEAVSGELHVTAPSGVLTDAVKQEIAANKEQLLDIVAGATDVLNRYGVRLIGAAIGIWRDADIPEVRRAIRVVGLGEAEIRHLDDPDAKLSSRYRGFVPQRIQEIWEEKGTVGTPQERVDAELQARFINAVFDRWGTSPKPSRITAATVLHGELARRRRKL